jgi:leader peptidase (prepilin peptidase) / N-methyltransferase
MVEQLPRTLLLGLAGVLGACLGSFANVLIHRLPRDLSPARGRSACPRCGQPIAWYDNVPILSWLLLHARCRHCRAPISPRYVLVEAAGAALAVAAVAACGPTWRALAAFAFLYLLGVIAVVDWGHMIIPHTLTIAGMLGGLVLAEPAGPGLARSALGLAIGCGGVLALSHGYRLVRGQPGMGDGDAMLMGMVGAWLGPWAVAGVMGVGALLGTVYALVRGAGRLQGDAKLPFGTFLAAAAAAVFWAGPAAWKWYLGLLA